MVVEPLCHLTKTIETDISILFEKLEWWTVERCYEEPLPEFLLSDPHHYSPEILPRIFQHSVPNNEMIISMIWRGEQSCDHYGSTFNTLGLWNASITKYTIMPGHRPKDYNPYADKENVGTIIELEGRQCQECGRVKAKGYAPSDKPCKTC
eukprot:9665937-Ditylum_brightwellii.AAC.1